MTSESDPGRVLPPAEVVADFLSGLPYDFPDDANPQEDAAGVIAALTGAGYVVVSREEAELVLEDADHWCGHVADETYGHTRRFDASLKTTPARVSSEALQSTVLHDGAPMSATCTLCGEVWVHPDGRGPTGPCRMRTDGRHAFPEPFHSQAYGLSYPERWQQAVERGAELGIYVPAPGANTTIAARSGIVGGAHAAGTLLCYFEGWLHGAAQYAHLDVRGRWEAAIRHAAGRAVTEYPTVARQVLRMDQMTKIGTYYVATDTIEVTDEAELARWLA